MKIMLVGAEPDRMPRLKLFYKCLKSLGYDVEVFAPFQRKGNSVVRYLANMVKLIFTKADVYHFFNVPDVIGLPLLFKRGKVIYDSRSPWKEVVYDSTGNKIYSKLAGLIEKLLIKRADQVTAANTILAFRTIRLGANFDILEVVPNYPFENVKPKKVDIPKRDMRKYTGVINANALFFGKISWVEGLRPLMDILLKVKDQHIITYIAGDGPQLEVLMEYLVKNEITNVKLLGWLSKEELFGYIQEVDFCIMPRESGGTSEYSDPNSVWKVNESLSLGCPVICSKVGGFTGDDDINILFTVENKDFFDMIGYLSAVTLGYKKKPIKRDWTICRNILREVYEEDNVSNRN